MKVNGEGIYGTRSYEPFGEGETVRFTRNGLTIQLPPELEEVGTVACVFRIETARWIPDSAVDRLDGCLPPRDSLNDYMKPDQTH